ncbi:MAG: hypothetical protein HN403_17600 [Rhodospirillales bacterium]|nr:hypothetical protein [Rhodospirillales bacterium]
MGLRGSGALIFWHDIREGGESDYEAWHSHEHMRERIGVPGFLRGRRGTALNNDGPRYLILYEVEEASVLTSDPYLARLNDPTPWTLRVVANFINTNRTISRVSASAGDGVGSIVLTIRFSPRVGEEIVLRDWLSQNAFPELASTPGLTGVHLLESDVQASETDTAEKKLRDSPDDVADWVLVVEGYNEENIKAARDGVLSVDNLSARGAADSQLVDLFQIVHCVS